MGGGMPGGMPMGGRMPMGGMPGGGPAGKQTRATMVRTREPVTMLMHGPHMTSTHYCDARQAAWHVAEQEHSSQVCGHQCLLNTISPHSSFTNRHSL
jgi:hypothetical protein